jgi:5S rRNA maturation endonuclease (ribonuclease M5)
VDTIIVEGSRDEAALRHLGYGGRIDICSRVSVSDADLVECIAEEASSAVILTDFDEEGRKLNRSLKGLMERRGVKVESGLRRQFGRITAVLGVYAIEDLDNVAERA